jgi:hypothetical protein
MSFTIAHSATADAPLLSKNGYYYDGYCFGMGKFDTLIFKNLKDAVNRLKSSKVTTSVVREDTDSGIVWYDHNGKVIVDTFLTA